jgi:hypothetical protein
VKRSRGPCADAKRLSREALARAEQQQREAHEKVRVARRRFAVVAVLLAFVAVALHARSCGGDLWQAQLAARQTQLATARQLAAQAQLERTPLNLLLALESISITQRIGTFSSTASRQLLNNLLSATGGIPLQHTAPVKAVGFSPDDRWSAAANGTVVQLWNMQAPFTKPLEYARFVTDTQFGRGSSCFERFARDH